MRARAFACDGKNDFVFTQSHTVRAAGAQTCTARAGQLTGGEQAGSGRGRVHGLFPSGRLHAALWTDSVSGSHRAGISS